MVAPGPTAIAGGPIGPAYGPPPKDKGPAMTTVMKDNLDIAIAKTFRTTHKDVDIAIIKATTSKFSVVPKEKHVRTLKAAVHGAHPGSYTGYVITKLMERLHGAKDWLCALKCLMVFHRLMRESEGASFVAELLRFSDGGRGGIGSGMARHTLNMDGFVDTSSAEGRFDYSEWIRAYARYLDEQLDVFNKIAFYQVMQEAEGAAPTESKMRNLPPDQLLTHLPPLQHLLGRLMDTIPRGVAARHYVAQAAFLTVVKESFQVYRSISEGIINLADCFFEMNYDDASKGLDIYKQHTLDNDKLGEFYAKAESIDELKRSATFPKLSPPSPDFVTMMEEYVETAPRPEGDAASKKSPPLRKGRNAPKEKEVDELPPPVDSGLSGVIHPKEEEEVKEAEPEPAPAPEPELDLLNFDEPEETVPEPPPREKTATELLEEQQAAAAAAAGPPNGAAYAQQPQPPASNNPFGEGAAFGGQQQQQQGAGFGAGAVVPYGANTFGGAGPGWGAPQQYGYGQPQYGYGQQQYGYGGAPVQPGAMVPYGMGSPGYGIHNSPLPQQSPNTFNRSPTPSGGYTPNPALNQSQSFKDAALSDPFADLGPVNKPVAQTTPPLREVSPTQQRINLGRPAQPSFPQQQYNGQWQQQQPQQQNGFANFPSAPSPGAGTPPGQYPPGQHPAWGRQ